MGGSNLYGVQSCFLKKRGFVHSSEDTGYVMGRLMTTCWLLVVDPAVGLFLCIMSQRTMNKTDTDLSFAIYLSLLKIKYWTTVALH